MSSGEAQKGWHYLVGLEVRGPVSIDQLSDLITAGTLADTAMISSEDSVRWRLAKEVLEERRRAESRAPAASQSASDNHINGPNARDLFDKIGSTLNQVAGTEKLERFDLHEMFSETFQSRTVAEMEQYLIVGTDRTTPRITEVATGWPKPWLFMRFLLFFFMIYAAFVMAYQHFQNDYLVPGLIVMGTSAMPLATLILFFELNTPRNVSIYRLLILVGLGGIASLAISLIGFNFGHLNWLGNSSAGIVEELGKLTALILMVRGTRYKYILNGMLFGAAIGAGFACFESAGYAYRTIRYDGPNAMLSVIWLRGLLAPLMHVAWTAMVGAALWRVKGQNPITLGTLFHPRFLRILFLAMILHMLWNSPFATPFYFKELALGAAAWFVIWGLVQQGLHQVRDEQRTLATTAEPQPPQPFLT